MEFKISSGIYHFPLATKVGVRAPSTGDQSPYVYLSHLEVPSLKKTQVISLGGVSSQSNKPLLLQKLVKLQLKKKKSLRMH